MHAHTHTQTHTNISHSYASTNIHTYTHNLYLYLYYQVHGIQFWLWCIAHMHVSHQEAATLVVLLAAVVPAFHLYLYLRTTARPGYVAPIWRVSQQEATRLVDPLAAVTPALSPQLLAWPHQYSSVLIFGPARPMR